MARATEGEAGHANPDGTGGKLQSKYFPWD